MNKPNLKKTNNDLYNEDYYERGVFKGISGYMNFSWMPELTMRMAHYLINELPIARTDVVLDFGCAKGFFVKALRILDIDAYGVDISSYAISNTDAFVRRYCKLIKNVTDRDVFEREYDLMIAKDVFEHMTENDLDVLLRSAHKKVCRMFVVVPLSRDDHCGKYIIPEYDKDITHILAKTKKWWWNFFEHSGWNVSKFEYSFKGCKENWTSAFQKGNGFFILESFTDKKSSLPNLKQ